VNAAHQGRDNLKEITMSTKNTNSSTRRMTAAALMVAAVGALAVGGVGAAAIANAKPGIENPSPPVKPGQRAPITSDRFSAIALSPETGVWASKVNATSSDAANNGALGACQNAGGNHCLLVGTAHNDCVAVSVDAVNWDSFAHGNGPTKISAMNAALSAQGGGRIATTACGVPNGQSFVFTGRVNQLAGS
jgi:hypothetical protein